MSVNSPSNSLPFISAHQRKSAVGQRPEQSLLRRKLPPDPFSVALCELRASVFKRINGSHRARALHANTEDTEARRTTEAGSFSIFGDLKFPLERLPSCLRRKGGGPGSRRGGPLPGRVFRSVDG